MKNDYDKLLGLRHWLHAHPEISRQEVKTAAHLRQFLQTEAPPDRIIPLAGAGFAAVYDGAQPGKTILIRCELDALPIHEVNDALAHRSIFDGVGHKCGHDGHMTILAGVAQRLVARPAKGRVVLLFQPDEETGSGARQCLAHENFQQITPDFVFALHNLPGFALGAVICRVGTFAAQVKYAAVTFTGKEAHSAQPETGVSPAVALAELTLKAREIQAKYDSSDSYALLVPVYGQMGVQASGVAPAQGQAHFTLRAPDGFTVEAIWDDLTRAAQVFATAYGLKVAFEIKEDFTATVNGQAGFDMIEQAAGAAGLGFGEIDHPFRWGEDFGALTKRFEGGMFGLGAGEKQPALHTADYDFPDGLLAPGIAMFAALIETALAR
ncbi:MAG: amidohydrolase [Sulfitobacter sp.]